MNETNENDKKKEIIRPLSLSMPPKSEAEKRVEKAGRVKALSIAFLLLVTMSTGFIGGWIGSESRSENYGMSNGTVNRQVILNESQLISDIAKNVGPSVVSVNVTSQGIARDSFFGFPQEIEQQSAGTGIILEKDYIVTNRHVIPAGTTEVSITLADGTELTDVEVVGRTTDNDPLDIAFLKVNDKKGKDLTPAKLGDSAKVQVGDKVIAIGNALGQFQNTVTSGIISGYGRNIEAGTQQGSGETLQNLLQTDASINEGNSGGPLVNISGEVIGINTAVAAGGAENIGFAIPVNDVKGLIKSVYDKGKLERPYLGIRYITLTDDIAYQLNLEVKRGAYLGPVRGGSPILSDSPAAKAGLKEKDIITKVDGVEINEDNSLISLLSRKQVGETVELTIIRNGNEMKLNARLEAAPQQ